MIASILFFLTCLSSWMNRVDGVACNSYSVTNTDALDMHMLNPQIYACAYIHTYSWKNSWKFLSRSISVASPKKHTFCSHVLSPAYAATGITLLLRSVSFINSGDGETVCPAGVREDWFVWGVICWLISLIVSLTPLYLLPPCGCFGVDAGRGREELQGWPRSHTRSVKIL